jgi:hypothetical protein
MNFSTNPYYDPERCGLEILHSVDTGGSYEFDMFIVWKKLDDGTLWWDTDSGCSCPVPFEYDRNDLKQINEGSFRSFLLELEGHYRISRGDIESIKRDVKRRLNF